MPLTDEQKLEALKLRKEEYSYREIAERIGSYREQVRGYFRTKAARQTADELGLDIKVVSRKKAAKTKQRTCAHCHSVYYRSNEDNSGYKYCSEECKVKERKRRKRATAERKAKALKERTKVCIACGGEFIRNSSTQKYCSKECSQEERECAVCGKAFRTARSANTKTCSKKCGRAATKSTHGEYYKAFSVIHQGMIVPTSLYEGTEHDMTAFCLVCKKETTRKAGHFIDKSRTRGCEHCTKTLSVGEDKIERWLIDNGVKYKKEYTFEDLTHEQRLRFDFGILNDEEELVMLIEYDGIQHFKPRKQFGGIPFLLEQQRSDKMKNEYAKDNNIRLLRISYKEKNQVGIILSREMHTIAPR